MKVIENGGIQPDAKLPEINNLKKFLAVLIALSPD